MKHPKRSTSLILVMLLALSVGLSACGGSTNTSGPTATSAPPSPVAGDFVGAANSVDYISISSSGQQVIAYTCDGVPDHQITFAVWFKGAVNHNAIDLSATDGSHLVATLSPQAATGIVTLKDGRSFSFTANAVTDPTQAGLFRSEATFNAVPYVDGVILLPSGSFEGGVINTQTGAIIGKARIPPKVGVSDTVPNVGVFTLTQCHLGVCS